MTYYAINKTYVSQTTVNSGEFGNSSDTTSGYYKNRNWYGTSNADDSYYNYIGQAPALHVGCAYEFSYADNSSENVRDWNNPSASAQSLYNCTVSIAPITANNYLSYKVTIIPSAVKNSPSASGGRSSCVGADIYAGPSGNTSKFKDVFLFRSLSSSISFNANGGTGTDSREITSLSGSKTPPTVSRSGYVFTGWYTKASGGDLVTTSMTGSITVQRLCTYLSGDGTGTLYAHWKKQVTISVGVKTDGSVSSSGGTVSKSSFTAYEGDAISYNGRTLTVGSTSSQATANSGYSFSGWSPTPSGTVGTSNLTFYATFGTIYRITPYDETIEGIGGISTTGGTTSASASPLEVGNGTTFSYSSDNPRKVVFSNGSYLTAGMSNGYEINYWSKKRSDASSWTRMYAGSTYEVDRNTDIRATRKIKKYTIQFTRADNNGSISNNGGTNYVYGDNVSSTATPNEGYNFSGWYYKAVGSDTYSLYSSQTTISISAGGVYEGEFQARFSEKTYNISIYIGTNYASYTYNGETYSPSSYKLFTVNYWSYPNRNVSVSWAGKTNILTTDNTYQRTYTDYEGSYRDVDVSQGTTSIYPDPQSASVRSTTNYYRCYISFSANGGSGSVPSSGYSEWYQSSDGTVYCSWYDVRPTRTNYTFLGWAIDNSSATQPDIYAGSTGQWIQYGSHTLYAVWQEGYQVNALTHSSSSGRGSVSKSKTYAKRNETVTITATPGSGYQFQRWNMTTSNGASLSSTTNNPATITMGSSQNGPVTVYAYFDFIPRNVTFYRNDGTSTVLANVLTNTDGKLTSMPPDPSRTESGYVYPFAGWNTEQDGTGEFIESTSQVLPVTCSALYAIWEDPVVIITFDTQGSDKETFQVSGMPLSYITLSEQLPGSKSGYYFAGWCKGGIGEIYIVQTNQYQLVEDTTLYAFWKRTPLITFDSNGGIFSDQSTSKTVYTVVDANNQAKIPQLPNPPTYSPWTFDGWQYQGNTIDTDTVWPLGHDYTVYAHWDVQIGPDYNIEFTQFSDNVRMGQVTYFACSVTPLTEWQDVIWEVSDDSFKITYPSASNRQTIGIVPTITGRTATLKAVCSVDSDYYVSGTIESTTNASVVFMVDGTKYAEITTTGTLIALPTPPPYKEGYVFNSWLTEAGEVVMVGMAVPVNMVCYANFTPIETSESLGRDILILQVLNKEKTAVMKSLDMGSIQAFTEAYSIDTTSTPTPTQSANRTFVIDKQITESLTISFRRISPTNVDNSSSDSKRWSNAKWYAELKSIVNRWQGATDGLKVLYLPLDCTAHTVGTDETAYYGQAYHLFGNPSNDIGYLYNGQRYLGINGYIKSFVPKYTAGEPEVISGTMMIVIGGMTSNYVIP